MERPDEPIQVVARFRKGKIEPTKFLWGGRPQTVKSVTGKWATRDGADKIYHFAVLNDAGTYFEISLRTRDMGWRLDRYDPDGAATERTKKP